MGVTPCTKAIKDALVRTCCPQEAGLRKPGSLGVAGIRKLQNREVGGNTSQTEAIQP